jgi:glycosyltransferase involved in cell wall biosynthesis
VTAVLNGVESPSSNTPTSRVNAHAGRRGLPRSTVRLRMAIYRVAAAVARMVLRFRAAPPKPHSDGSAEKVHFLLMHAWGMGGTIRTTLNLAGYLAERRDVEIISIVRRRDEPFFPFPPGVKVSVVDDQRESVVTRWSPIRRLLRALPSFALFPGDRARRACTLWTDAQLLRMLRRVDAGVLIGTRPALNLIALDTKRPGVGVVGVEHMHYSQHRPLERAEMRRRYPKLDALVVLTEHDLREYGEVLPAGTRLVRIPNAVPDPEGPPSNLSDPVVLAAGRLTPQKGYDRLIRAFAKVAQKHPEWTLRICGSGGRRRALGRLIRKCGVSENVRLMGAVKNLEDEMASASLFVLSSRFEGLPMVMLEAMRKGLPVVSFDCPTGPREVIEDGKDGMLVADGDLDALAGAMIELIEDDQKRFRYGAAAAAKAAGFSLAVVGPKWDALLSSLLGVVS